MFSRHIIRHSGLTTILAALGAAPALAAPRFDPMFGDHAVIQRDHPVTVTGRSDPGEAIAVTLSDQVRQVRADREGRFAASFGPLATAGPVVLEARAASGSIVAQDVMVGDVFVVGYGARERSGVAAYCLQAGQVGEGVTALITDGGLGAEQFWPANAVTHPQGELAALRDRDGSFGCGKPIAAVEPTHLLAQRQF